MALLERGGIFYPSELVLCQDVVFLGVQVFDFYGPFLSLVKGAFDPPNRVVSCQGVRAREQACAPLKWHLGEPCDLGVSCRCEIKSGSDCLAEYSSQALPLQVHDSLVLDWRLETPPLPEFHSLTILP